MMFLKDLIEWLDKQPPRTKFESEDFTREARVKSVGLSRWKVGTKSTWTRRRYS